LSRESQLDFCAKIFVMNDDIQKMIRDDLSFNWHPYTQMKDHETNPPIYIKYAKGIKLYDAFGNWYYDTISSWWCNLHGHRHPKIIEAIKNQLKKIDHIMFAGFTHCSAIELSKKLVEIAPKGIKRVFYSDNGSTAVETAIKMSVQYWANKGYKNKNKIISLDMAYHGDTVGAMSLSGVDLFNKVFSPLFFKTYKIPTPYCYRCPFGKERESCSIDCIEPLKKLLKKRSEEICAIILEPLLLGAAGMIIYPKEYLKKVYQLAKKYNIHLIADEVATGFGRTGKMFAVEHAKISPDFICLSKGLTNGTMAFAATLTTEEIFMAFFDDYEKKKTFYHGHTFTANPIACSVALANLEIFKSEDPLNNALKISLLLRKELSRFRNLPNVGDVRFIGTVGAIELVKDKKTKEQFGFKERIGYKIYREGLKKHLILRPIGNVVYFYLPLCTKEKQLNEILSDAYEIISSVMKSYASK